MVEECLKIGRGSYCQYSDRITSRKLQRQLSDTLRMPGSLSTLPQEDDGIIKKPRVPKDSEFLKMLKRE